MQSYRVASSQYFAPYLEGFGWEFEQTRGPMCRLVDRYQLRGKRVLSIGPGIGSEEYWLWRHGGCALTFVDSDEHNSIEPALQALPAAGDELPEAEVLSYFIGDAAALSRFAEPFELIYISGFTPEELRRRQIQLETVGTGLRGALHRLCLRPSWPAERPVLSDFTLRFVADCLAEDGMLLLQEYYAPIDCTANGHMIRICQEQLRGEGIELLEHHHSSDRPWVRLWTARRAGAEAARTWLRGIDPGPQIESILGRILRGAPARRSFSLLQGDTPDLAWLRRIWWRRAPRRMLEIGSTAGRLLWRRVRPERA